MTASTTTRPGATVPAAAPTPRLVGGIAVAALAAVVVNVLLGLGLTALVSGPAVGLELGAWISMSIAGVLIGTAGWALVRRFAPRPAALLRVLVPVALVVSWIPDLVALATGATLLNVAGLAVMHVVVAAACVTVLPRVLPVR